MKIIIRYFFKTIRLIIGPIMLFLDWVTTPRGIKRPEDEQKQLDEKTANMAIYQFKTCPFCMKVRRELKRSSLNIELRDAQHNPQNRAELEAQGGKVMVPCLKIVDDKGDAQWLYESDKIIEHLKSLSKAA